MKTKHIITAACLSMTSLLTFTSCTEWFDISPKTDLKAEELFDSESGFQSALTGIYLTMTSPSLYAGGMSFGLLDQLAQQYDFKPDGVQDISSIYDYQNNNSGYQTKQRLASMWSASYNVIANSNNLIKWIDTKGNEIVKKEETRRMLRGEALAIRAFCHFDLLRAWGPYNYRNNTEAPQTLTIPYRTIADNSKMPRLAAEEVLNKIVADLLQARELLSFENQLNLKIDTERRFRFNYHAVNALLARVYAYQGKKTEAIETAKAVIDHCGLNLQSTNQNDAAMFSECLVGLNMYKMSDELSGQWGVGEKFTTQYVINQNKFNQLFEVEGSRRDDFRSKTSAFHVFDTQQLAISKKYNQNANAIIPLIRLPEMYYILCEMSDELTTSRYYLNFIRNKRGYSSALNESYTDNEGKIIALDKEIRKEYYAEGQYWFFLKLHGITSIPYATDITLDKAKFEFPLPDAEVQYGWTPENDE